MRQACILCKGKDISTKHVINGFHILQCKSCSLLFVGERLLQEELNDYYKADYVYDDFRNIENLKFYYTKLGNLISKKISAGKILDVGCLRGHFFESMQGWECHGIELESQAAEEAKAKYGNNIHIGTLEDYEFRPKYFDVITLQDVLDHMLDPLDALTKCNVLLKPNGLIIIKVHDIASLFARLMGARYYALIPPYHLTYFSKKTLAKALGLCGFEVEEYRYFAHMLFLKTIFFRLSRHNKQNFFYRLCQTAYLPFGNIRIKKNMFDIVTVLARKNVSIPHE
jgi:2-polyprenyl-3-methyl-5-hydroxy-6-metoxy-1,4-benzoquinol methylase